MPIIKTPPKEIFKKPEGGNPFKTALAAFLNQGYQPDSLGLLDLAPTPIGMMRTLPKVAASTGAKSSYVDVVLKNYQPKQIINWWEQSSSSLMKYLDELDIVKRMSSSSLAKTKERSLSQTIGEVSRHHNVYESALKELGYNPANIEELRLFQKAHKNARISEMLSRSLTPKRQDLIQTLRQIEEMNKVVKEPK